jgi:hypothetical protein
VNLGKVCQKVQTLITKVQKSGLNSRNVEQITERRGRSREEWQKVEDEVEEIARVSTSRNVKEG